MVYSKRLKRTSTFKRAKGLSKCLPTNDRGVAMILAITTLIVLNVIGVAALTSTNVELKVASNEKTFNVALYNGEAGINVASEVLEEAIYMRGWGLPGGSSHNYKNSTQVMVDDTAFWNEPIVSTTNWPKWPLSYCDDQDNNSIKLNQTESNRDEDSVNKDLTVSLPLGGSANLAAEMDVDYLHFDVQQGGSTLTSMGYEGAGKGIAAGGSKRVYGFAIRGDGPGNNRVRIYNTYEHIL